MMDNDFRPNLQRVNALDTARGVAVLGILLVNIFSFALPEMARATPLMLVDATALDSLFWYLIHIFADTKFITMLTLVFGASLWFFGEHKSIVDPTAIDVLQLRRNLWLLAFGLLHGYLIWGGDILFTYAVCAFIAWHWRHWSDACLLKLSGAIFLLEGVLVFLVMAVLPAELTGELMTYPTADDIADEIAYHQRDWWAIVPERIQNSIGLQFSIIFSGWSSLAIMLVGIVLARRGFLTLQASLRAYRILIALTLLPGLGLIALELCISIHNGFTAGFIYTGGYQLHYWGSSLVGVAYILSIMYWCRTTGWQFLQRVLAAVGRMALSIYIMQSLICTWLFYGYGFGWYGQLSLSQLMLIVLCIWLFQCAFACWWLLRYNYGPLEWLWRSLVYRHRQVFKR